MDKVAFEIVIISAQDLKCVTSFGRPMRTYALVWSDSATQNSTRIDGEGGSYPTWNQKFQMTVTKGFLQQKGSALVVQIYCKTMMGNKRMGSARMPYSDILEGFTSPDSIHFLSYRIRMPNGMPRGTLDFSLKFLEKIDPPIRSSRAPSQIKFPAFPSKLNIPASSSGQGNRRPQNGNKDGAVNGYAIGIPLQNSTNTSYGYPYHARVSPFNF